MISSERSTFDHVAARSDDITLLDIWRILARYRLIVLTVASAVTLIATATAFLMKPVYRASVLVVPVAEQKPSSALADLASEFGGLSLGLSDNRRQEALATLRSRAFSLQFIEEKKILPKLFPEVWDEAASRWTTKSGRPPSASRTFKRFDEKVRTIAEDRTTGLVTVSIEHMDRMVVADWANSLVRQMNDYARKRAIDEAQRSIEYLRNELSRTDAVDVAAAINRLIEQQLNEIMLANVRQDYLFRVIDPAQTPDERSYVRPNRILIIALGVIGGLILGALAALMRHALASAEHTRSND